MGYLTDEECDEIREQNKQLKEELNTWENKSLIQWRQLKKIKEFFEHNDILHKEYYQKMLDSQEKE